MKVSSDWFVQDNESIKRACLRSPSSATIAIAKPCHEVFAAYPEFKSLLDSYTFKDVAKASDKEVVDDKPSPSSPVDKDVPVTPSKPSVARRKLSVKQHQALKTLARVA